jgi:hypothetical protein
MKLLENLDYKEIISVVTTFALLSNPVDVYKGININEYYYFEGKKYEYIAFSKENNFYYELAEILSYLEMKFSKIKDFWVPAKDMLDKVCVFIAFEEQEKLEEQYEDLELTIYLEVKELLDKFEFIEMVALL